MSDEDSEKKTAEGPAASEELAASEEPAEPVAARDAEDGPPIADPMVGSAAAVEADVVMLERFAARAGVLSKTSLAIGVLAFVLVLVAFTGRVDLGVVLYVAPVGALNVALGVLLGRAAASLSDAAKTRYQSRASLASALGDLHKVFGVQLLASGFLAFLLLIALLIAAAFQRGTEI